MLRVLALLVGMALPLACSASLTIFSDGFDTYTTVGDSTWVGNFNTAPANWFISASGGINGTKALDVTNTDSTESLQKS